MQPSCYINITEYLKVIDADRASEMQREIWVILSVGVLQACRESLCSSSPYFNPKTPGEAPARLSRKTMCCTNHTRLSVQRSW